MIKTTKGHMIYSLENNQYSTIDDFIKDQANSEQANVLKRFINDNKSAIYREN